MPDLKRDCPSASDSKEIPSLPSLYKHLRNDYTASLYLWLNGFVPNHSGKACEGTYQKPNARNKFPCKGKYQIRITPPIFQIDDGNSGKVIEVTPGSVVWTPRECCRPKSGGKPCTHYNKKKSIFWGTIFEDTPNKPSNEILRGVVLFS